MRAAKGYPRTISRLPPGIEKAAEQGVAAAQYNLGVMYANGQGVAANPQEASKWFLKAADQGVVDAANGLGRMYYEGEGAFKNYAEAEKWYRKAADQGVASAAFNLGVMYDLGQGVPKDYARGAQVVSQGRRPGICRRDGEPRHPLLQRPRREARSRAVLRVVRAGAETRRSPRAASCSPQRANKLKPGDLKKAQALAAEWQPPAKQPTQVADARLFKPEPSPRAAPPQRPRRLRAAANIAAADSRCDPQTSGRAPIQTAAATPQPSFSRAARQQTAPATPQEPPAAKTAARQNPTSVDRRRSASSRSATFTATTSSSRPCWPPPA